MKQATAILAELAHDHGSWSAPLLLLATVIPLFLPGLAGVFLVAACVVLVVAHRADHGHRSGRHLLRSPLGWMTALYLCYVLGLAWSTNMDYAVFDLQVKALMLLIPLVVLLVPERSRSGGTALLNAFAVACALASASCMAVAVGHYVHHVIGYHGGTMNAPTTAYFISSNFSLFLHPSYFALYLMLALVFVELHPFASRVWGAIIRGLLIAGAVLCASKAGWMAMGAWWTISLVLHWRDKASRRRVFSGASAAVALLAMLVLLSPFFQEKVGQFSHAAKGAPVDVSAKGSTESRELIWAAAGPLIREHMPWGTGTGDVKDVLIQRYRELGYTHAVEQRLNAHSQLLQTPLTLGLPGALLMVCLLLVPAVHAIKHRDELMVAFIVLLALNWAVESMLETQAGVLFLSWGALMLAMRSSPPEPILARTTGNP
jgi:hypothetical protein